MCYIVVMVPEHHQQPGCGEVASCSGEAIGAYQVAVAFQPVLLGNLRSLRLGHDTVVAYSKTMHP